jgi:hypothetical protein
MTKIILLSVVVLWISAALVIFLLKKFQPQLNSLYSWKRNFLLAGGYLGVLIIFIPLTAVMDRGELIISQNPDKELIALAPEDWSAAGIKFGLPEDGKFETQKGLYKNSAQTFPVEGKLEIKMSEDTEYNRVYLARKESADGVVEVSTYVAPHYVGNNWDLSLDITKLINPPQISLENGVLKIQRPIHEELVFGYFDDNFTLKQFEQKDQSKWGSRHGVRGERGILIEVPSDLEIVYADYLSILWVE